MSLYLVDNSVLQRVRLVPEVGVALRKVITTESVATCLPVMLEAGYSARNVEEHDQVLGYLRTMRVLHPDAAVLELAVELQRSLWSAGRGRAAGISDLQIAATALVYDAVVLHYDADFDQLAAVSQLRAHWVVPRGSVT